MDVIYSLPGIHQPLSSGSHLAGAAIFAMLGWYLLRPLWGDWRRFFSVAVFVMAAIGLLLISSTFHLFVPGSYARAVMLRLDLAAIFVLIAATFTPIHAILFSGWQRWGLLALIWSIAVAGITVRLMFFETISRQSGAAMFLTMGWIGAYTASLLWRNNARALVLLTVAGGVLYSVGAIANAVDWPTLIPGIWGPHETLHFAVLGGLSCHWAVVVGAAEQSGANWTRATVPIADPPLPVANSNSRSSRAA